jgi:3-oxoacid CoA-transferase subunit A
MTSRSKNSSSRYLKPDGRDRRVAKVVDKVAQSFADAVADVTDGSTLAVGGFGVCGVPFGLIGALVESGVRDLRVVSNNCGTDGLGLGRLLEHHQISRMTSSYVGENREFAQQFLSGQLEVELIPQGTLAERLRAGGCGIPAFYTPAGVGTQVADGGLPWRYAPDGSVAVASPPREVREFGGAAYVLEESVRTDFALVRASKGDTMGNLIFHQSTRNFNPLCAMAGRVTLVEVEELVPVGELDPDEVHLPGVFVHRIVQAESLGEKPIERRTVRSGPDSGELGR